MRRGRTVLAEGTAGKAGRGEALSNIAGKPGYSDMAEALVYGGNGDEVNGGSRSQIKVGLKSQVEE